MNVDGVADARVEQRESQRLIVFDEGDVRD